MSAGSGHCLIFCPVWNGFCIVRDYHLVVWETTPRGRAGRKEVRDLIIPPPAVKQFKSRTYCKEETVTTPQLGNRKPLQFLRHLKHLAREITLDRIMWYIFLRRLLPTFHTVVIGKETPMVKLARITDNLTDLNLLRENPTIMAEISGNRNSELDPSVNFLF